MGRWLAEWFQHRPNVLGVVWPRLYAYTQGLGISRLRLQSSANLWPSEQLQWRYRIRSLSTFYCSWSVRLRPACETLWKVVLCLFLRLLLVQLVAVLVRLFCEPQTIWPSCWVNVQIRGLVFRRRFHRSRYWRHRIELWRLPRIAQVQCFVPPQIRYRCFWVQCWVGL